MGTVTKNKNIFQRLFSSIIGILLGFALIFGMFILAIIVETRENPASVAKNAIEINVQDAAANEGEFVVFSEKIESFGKINDMAMKDTADFVSLSAFVEVFAWVQESKETKTTKIGGTETTTTVYTYAKAWTTDLNTDFSQDTSGDIVKITAQKENTAVKNDIGNVNLGYSTKNNDNINIGGVKIKTSLKYDNYTELTESDLVGKLKNTYTLNGKYAVDDKAGALGSIRISYSAIKTNTKGTVAGKLVKESDGGMSLAAYKSERGTEIYSFIAGINSKAEYESFLNSLHNSFLWMLRIIIVILMAVGFGLITKPLSVVLSVIPFLGRLSNGVLAVVSMLLGVVAGVIAIIIGITIKYWFITIPILAVIIILAAIYGKKKKSAQNYR